MSTRHVQILFDKLLLGEVKAVKIPFDNYNQRETVRTLFYRQKRKLAEVDPHMAASITITRLREEDIYFLIVTTATHAGNWFNKVVVQTDKGSEVLAMGEEEELDDY